MARYRWTLALIILLPILATVITAFRVRDLPKSYDTSKLETKKTQQCEHCDVKVGQKVHSVKIESDKHKYEDLKKAEREKQLIDQKTSGSKSRIQHYVRSDEDDDDGDDLEFTKIQTGFKQEQLKVNKISKSESDLKLASNIKKSSVDIRKSDKSEGDDSDNEDDDDDDDNDDFDDQNQDDDTQSLTKLNLKIKSYETKKTSIKVNLNKKKETRNSEPNNEDNDGDDDDDDNDDGDENENRDKVPLKPKLIEKKKTSSEALKVDVRKPQQKSVIASLFEDDDESDDDDDDDDYNGLDNIDELFKILDKKPNSKSKDEPGAIHEVKTKTLEKSAKKSNPIDNNGGHQHIDDNDNDDHDDDDDDYNKEKSNKITNKSKDSNKNKEVSSKISADKIPKKELEKQSQKREHEYLPKDKNAKPSLLNEIKQDVKRDETDSILKLMTETNKVAPKESKVVEKGKTGDGKDNKEKADEKIKTTKKEDKSVPVEHKIDVDKKKTDSIKKTKESEKETVKHKVQEKDVTSHEVKTPILKKEQSDHKDIFKTPENKKDIKYEFEKTKTNKDDQKSFDYSEFEKIQVSKSHHQKEKKIPKVSAEIDSESREEKYLKHVTDALNRRNLLKSEFEDFYAFFPTFAPNFSRIHNPECRRHGQILLRQLRGTKLWALNMLDATAKIPSGVLQGNGIQLGDFDQCLGSRARVQLDTGSVVKVQGKYCLARLDVKAENTELEAPVYLAQAKSLIRSRIDDPGHFVPRFSTLSWGVCVPAACDEEDVEVVIKDALKHYQHKSGLVIKVKVDEDDCHTDEELDWEQWLELPTILTLSFYGIIILLVLVATVQDYVARRQSEESQEDTEEQTGNDQKDDDEENKEKPKKQSDGILSQFSLYYSVSKLIAPGTSDEISCIHGIRGIATLALLVAHKFMPVAVMPYTNRLKITEMASAPWWSWCRAGWVFTDCFLLLSGTLTSHRISSANDSSAMRRLFSRYLRLTPALLAVVLFYAFIWDKLSTGPMWGTFVTKNAEICERSWWWNLLYVQNYFGMEDMCAPQTHQLALDMQLTILGGIIVWALQSGMGYAKLTLPALHLVSAYVRYTTVRDHRLTLLAYHGVSVSQLYRTARLTYTSTLHRCSPYLIGISLGLALQKPAKYGKFLLTLGWLTSIGLSGLVVWSGLDSGSIQYRYNANNAAQYAAIAPLASAMAIAWVIYAVHIGTCESLSRVLCWRPLVFISRISYALYLCQFIIFITNIGTVRTSKEFTLMSLIDLQEISAILLSSIILTVTFVIPMQSLHKMFTFQWKSESEESTDKEKDEPEQNTEKAEEEPQIEEKKEATPPTRSRHNLVAHREMLEEIPEMDVEYETQRENTEGLDEIIEEEEEGNIGEEEDQIDDLEIIEEEEAEEAGEEDWLEREGGRSLSRQEDHDIDEWEWTANGRGRSGAQYYRYGR